MGEVENVTPGVTRDENRGTLFEIQTAPTIPSDWQGTSHTADLHVHASGNFLYCSNRGHDSIAIFAIDQSTGKLTLLGCESTQGRTPRNFAIDPSGTWLLAANQDSSTIASYRIDQQSGRLTATGQITPAPTPVCLKFV
jgi:6-phosphogluconolactonase